METKVATAIVGGTAEQAAQELSSEIKKRLADRVPNLALVFASTQQPLETLMPRLVKEFPQTLIMGCSTAGEFTEKGDRKGSCAMYAVSGDFKVYGGMAKGIKGELPGTLQKLVDELPRQESDYPYRTGIVLLDPLSGTCEDVCLLLSNLMGWDVRLAGGAAGDDLKMKETKVALGAKVSSNAAALGLIFSKKPLGVGVAHGHEPLSRPMEITKAENNIVKEIGGRPAWEVWKEITCDDNRKLGFKDVYELTTPDEIGAFLLRYEAGIPTLTQTYKVRAPLAVKPDGSIVFACGISQGSFIRIMHSGAAKQIESARLSARKALQQGGGNKVAGALVFDCICRNLILQNQFAQALKAIRDELGGVPIAGFETYGEIAMDAGDMSGFHNTTTVVLTFPE